MRTHHSFPGRPSHRHHPRKHRSRSHQSHIRTSRWLHRHNPDPCGRCNNPLYNYRKGPRRPHIESPRKHCSRRDLAHRHMRKPPDLHSPACHWGSNSYPNTRHNPLRTLHRIHSHHTRHFHNNLLDNLQHRSTSPHSPHKHHRHNIQSSLLRQSLRNPDPRSPHSRRDRLKEHQSRHA